MKSTKNQFKNTISRGFSFGFMVLFFAASCSSQNNKNNNQNVSNNNPSKQTNMTEDSTLQTATFGAGCFWCVEAVFLNLEGVKTVQSGYSGGKIKNPSYKEVCTGNTGHAEVIQLTYDPKVVSFDELLEVFWKTHDPTTLNFQVMTTARNIVR
jgi:peptide-methionine (S)-S-oxide reductase